MSATPQIRVTVEDLVTGEVETCEVGDDYVILTAGSCYVDGIQAYPTKGTHVLTIKGRKAVASREAPASEAAREAHREAKAPQ